MLKWHQQAEALMAPWFVGEGGGEESGGDPVEVVQTYGELELEYAAVRKGCGLFDTPQRAVIEVAGSERLAFLNRMLTQELKGLKPREWRASFWLNRKGRIDADLRLFEAGASILIDVDVHAAKRTVEGLSAFIIADDVTVADVTGAWSRMSLHGPTSAMVMDEVAEAAEGSVNVGDLAVGGVTRVLVPIGEPNEDGFAEAASVWVAREDTTGEVGLELFVPREHAAGVYRRILETGTDPGLTIDGSRPTVGHKARLRPIGWHAYNIARIEAGTAVYNIDFGPESLPAESGIMERRVSLTKGCYLGQEIVARMHARGHPKQVLVAMKVVPPAHAKDLASGLSFMPTGGGGVYRMPEAGIEGFRLSEDDRVGTITSATLAPMLSASPVCFAAVKWDRHEAGSAHVVLAEGVPSRAVVQDGLAFVKRGA
jgi:tRNA-modifying protein YgfZ